MLLAMDGGLEETLEVDQLRLGVWALEVGRL